MLRHDVRARSTCGLILRITRAMAGAAIVCAASTGCRGLSAPTPPDLSGVVEAYRTPTAVLDVESGSSLTAGALDGESTLAEAQGFDILSALVDTLTAGPPPPTDASVQQADAGAAAADASTGVEIGGAVIEGNGYLRVERACEGAEDGGPRGAVQLTVLARETAIHEVVWGSFEHCRMGGNELQGYVALHLGGRLGLSGFGGTDFTVVTDITLTDARTGEQHRVAFDFQVQLSGATRFRAARQDGSHFIVSPGPTGWTVEAANGTFNCDFIGRSCQRADGEMVQW